MNLGLKVEAVDMDEAMKLIHEKLFENGLNGIQVSPDQIIDVTLENSGILAFFDV